MTEKFHTDKHYILNMTENKDNWKTGLFKSGINISGVFAIGKNNFGHIHPYLI